MSTKLGELCVWQSRKTKLVSLLNNLINNVNNYNNHHLKRIENELIHFSAVGNPLKCCLKSYFKTDNNPFSMIPELNTRNNNNNDDTFL